MRRYHIINLNGFGLGTPTEPLPPTFVDVTSTSLTLVMPPALYNGQWLNAYRWSREEGNPRTSYYIKLAEKLQPGARVPVTGLKPGAYYNFSAESWDPGPPAASWMSKLAGITMPMPTDIAGCIKYSLENRTVSQSCYPSMALLGGVVIVLGYYSFKGR